MFIVSVLLNLGSRNDTYIETVKIQQSYLFLNYVSAFDDYFTMNGSASGDVTSSVPLPAWLPRDDAIRMLISGGVAYVYMPLRGGVYSQVLNATGNSAMVGFTDNNSLNTINGKMAKPSFIPSGYLVYMR